MLLKNNNLASKFSAKTQKSNTSQSIVLNFPHPVKKNIKLPAVKGFTYLGSRNSKIFFNRKKLWSLSSHRFPVSNFKSNKLYKAFNFGNYLGLNFDKIGLWRYSGASLIWRDFKNISTSDLFYKPLRGIWKKKNKRRYVFKNFLPLRKSSFYYTRPSPYKLFFIKRIVRNFFNFRIFLKNVNVLLKNVRSIIKSNGFFFLRLKLLKAKYRTLIAFKKKYINKHSLARAPKKSYAKKSLNIDFNNYDSKNSSPLLKTLNLNRPRLFQSIFDFAHFEQSNNLLFSQKNDVAKFNRFFDIDAENTFNKERHFVNEFVHKKKTIRGLVVPDRKDARNIFVKSSTKYYYYYYKNDPLAGSYFVDKLISVFSSKWKKKTVRNVFYKLFFDINSEFSIDMLYSIIDFLKPTYINVKVRRGKEYYEAPILASDSKSTIKAIKFFKKAVLARKYNDSFYDKLRGELYDFFCWDGYKNNFYEEYVATSKKNMHLRHFRSSNRY